MTSRTSDSPAPAQVSRKRSVLETLGRAARGIEQSIERLATAVRWAPWPLVYACATGTFVWAILQEDATLKKLAENKVAWDQQLAIAGYSAASLAVLALVYVGAMVVDRVRRGRFAKMYVVGRLNRWLVALLALPLVAGLAERGIETRDPIWTALLAAGAALVVAVSVYAWPMFAREREPAAPTRLERAAPWIAGLSVAAMWIGYGYLLSVFAVTNHHSFNTRTIDLGYYDQIFYHSIHGRPLGCNFIKGGTHLSGHFDPILVLLSPLYLIYPAAELLLVLQSVWLGAGVVPAYLLGRAKLGSHGAGLVLAGAYFLYPALHGANMYEFHSLTLVAPLLLWLLYFLEQGRLKSYAVMLVVLTLCREDVPLLLCFVGFYAIISGRPRYARVGALTIAYCLTYYLIVRNFIMPAGGVLNTGSKEAYSYEYYFRDLIPPGKGALGLLVTLVSNPVYVLKTALANDKKILFLLQLFVPLGFLPFFARRARFMLLFGLLMALLASRGAVYDISFQYSCVLFPIAFAITPIALRQLREDPRLTSTLGLAPKRFVRAALAFVLVASALISWKFGLFVESSSFKGGFSRVARPPLSDAHHQRWLEVKQLIDMIPPGAAVATTNRLGAFVSNRKDAYFYHQRKETHYAFVDEREIKDRYKQWHEARKKSGELIELGRHAQFVLYQVDPSKKAETAAIQKELPKTQPAPRRRGKKGRESPPRGDGIDR